VPDVSGGFDEKCGEQAPDFVECQGDLVGRRGCSGAFGRREDGEESVGEHDQGGPPVPGGPSAELMLVEAGGAFAGLERFLDLPAGCGDPHQRREWNLVG
jgi:hypothetical protein